MEEVGTELVLLHLLERPVAGPAVIRYAGVMTPVRCRRKRAETVPIVGQLSRCTPGGDFRAGRCRRFSHDRRPFVRRSPNPDRARTAAVDTEPSRSRRSRARRARRPSPRRAARGRRLCAIAARESRASTGASRTDARPVRQRHAGSAHHCSDDPLLFRHYWQAESAFAAFAATTARPESQFNLNTFFQVVAGLSKHGCAYLRPSRPLDVETLILLGAADPVIDWPSVASAARTLFGHVEERTVANCGHWVHLERPDVFLKLVAKTSQRC